MAQHLRPDTESNPAEEAAFLRAQLEKLLAHPLFANSKRYPAFLAYVVEKTLAGSGPELKERCIGIDVFGRDPGYDANSDPVVRITAGEVRKRLTQYYYDPSHAGEPIIELPVGSYQPVFQRPARPAENEPALPEVEELPLREAPLPVQRTVPVSRFSTMQILLLGVISVASAIGGIAVGHLYKSHPAPTLVESFWSPFTAGTGTVTFCLGEPSQNLDNNSIRTLDTPSSRTIEDPGYFRLHMARHLALADVVTLTRTAAALETHHQPYRILPAAQAAYSQLREGPIVLIGAFDNLWTMRLTQNLRFGFENRDGQPLIIDRKNPKSAGWASVWEQPYEKLSKDHALVARFRDATTGQMVMVAAGISEEGTEAAGEMLYNPLYLQALIAHAPAHWEQMNMEAVLETQVIGGNPGPPQVLAVEFW